MQRSEFMENFLILSENQQLLMAKIDNLEKIVLVLNEVNKTLVNNVVDHFNSISKSIELIPKLVNLYEDSDDEFNDEISISDENSSDEDEPIRKRSNLGLSGKPKLARNINGSIIF